MADEPEDLITKEILRDILVQSNNVRKTNQKLIKLKLGAYKRISGDKSGEILRFTLELVIEQDNLMRDVRSNIMSQINTDVIGDLTNSLNQKIIPEKAESTLREVIPLLNKLINALFYQKNTLEDTNIPIESKMDIYKRYFQDELAIYKEYEEFAKVIINEMSLLKKDTAGLRKFRTEKYYRNWALSTIAAAFIVGLFLDVNSSELIISMIGAYVLRLGLDYNKALNAFKKISDAAKAIS